MNSRLLSRATIAALSVAFAAVPDNSLAQDPYYNTYGTDYTAPIPQGGYQNNRPAAKRGGIFGRRRAPETAPLTYTTQQPEAQQAPVQQDPNEQTAIPGDTRPSSKAPVKHEEYIPPRNRQTATEPLPFARQESTSSTGGSTFRATAPMISTSSSCRSISTTMVIRSARSMGSGGTTPSALCMSISVIADCSPPASSMTVLLPV